MGWPEYTLASLLILGIGVRIAKHGQPAAYPDGKPYKWNLWTYMFRVAIYTWLLWAGGFFD